MFYRINPLPSLLPPAPRIARYLAFLVTKYQQKPSVTVIIKNAPIHFQTLPASGSNSCLKHWNGGDCCNDWTMAPFFPVTNTGGRIPTAELHHVVALYLQVKRVKGHFQTHCRPSQTIQRGGVGSHANRHRWGGTPALSH